MPIYTFDSKGNRHEDHPYIKVDCYYSGYVEGAPDSDAVISTCSGLRGYVQIGNVKYEIQPVENSPTFQHLLYRKDPTEHVPCKHTPEDQAMREQAEADGGAAVEDGILFSESNPEFPGKNALSRYLEYFAVCDNAMFQRERRNETRVALAVLQSMSVLHSVYDDIGLHVVLTGMELWTERDRLNMEYELDKSLEALHSYAVSELWWKTHFNHAGLFTAVGEDSSFSPSRQGSLCIHNYVSVSAVTLGHVLGFAHDDPLGQGDGGICDCNCTSRPGRCIMFSAAAECHRLSNCSRNAYYRFLAKQGRNCFLNFPKDMFVMKACGNGVLEGNEECDCGRDEECRSNGCCQDDCKRKPGADCLSGPCCENCKIANEGKVCREAASGCDLPEYCTGESGSCPPDVHKQDGMPCGARNTCYLGACLDSKQHCTALFGRDANPAPLSCYKEVNSRGDRTGNCGKDRSGYKKCKEEYDRSDVFCGRIQCVDVKKLPRIAAGQAVLQTPVGSEVCWGIEFQGKSDLHDLGAVRDGSPCGENKICVNRTCVHLKILNHDCDFSKCNHQGVCNSKRNCHCRYGWAPPSCTGRGYGGSIDSGPPPERRKSKRSLMLGSLIGVALLLLALGLVLRKYLHSWNWLGRLIKEKASLEPMDSLSSPEATDTLSSPEPMDSLSSPENMNLGSQEQRKLRRAAGPLGPSQELGPLAVWAWRGARQTGGVGLLPTVQLTGRPHVGGSWHPCHGGEPYAHSLLQMRTGPESLGSQREETLRRPCAPSGRAAHAQHQAETILPVVALPVGPSAIKARHQPSGGPEGRGDLSVWAPGEDQGLLRRQERGPKVDGARQSRGSRGKKPMRLDENAGIAGSQHGFLRNKSCQMNLSSSFDWAASLTDRGDAVDIIELGFANMWNKLPPDILSARPAKSGLDGANFR
ncbi:disintegrin and metalloproteinase domain-containing protein 21-like [Varanus komodoensis]|uniref:disintegrin and metalloproteinase domain-containing protein 21-like n=1 Tax=Varanus komodoensis TaxID=61221 RepID=UPI001CF77BE3|nr:disintegrin and metalloproteinase domain-containing protein 21-like [Varanus komodoensis]